MLTFDYIKAKGITLIEVLVTLSIVAILTIIAVPSYFNYLNQSHVVEASNQQYQMLQGARSKAVMLQSPVNIVFVQGASWCYGMTSSNTCNCNIPGVCNLGQASYLDYDAVSLSAFDPVTNATMTSSFSVVVEEDRGEVTPAVTLVFSAGSYSVHVILNNLGQVSICSDNLAGYESC